MSSVGLDDTQLVAPPARIVPRRRWRSDPRWSGFLFVLPFLVIFAAFGAYPLLYALRISFTSWQGTGSPRWIGLGNYTYLLTSSDFWSSLRNSAVMWLLVVPIQTLTAVAAAVLLSRSRIKLKGAFRTTLIVPFVTPLVAMAQVWVLIFDQDYGVANSILRHVGLHSVGWLTTTQWAKPTLALLILWKTSGFALIIMLAAVVGIPDEVYEAAAVDGAGTIRKFWSLTIPLMRRPIAFYVVLGVASGYLVRGAWNGERGLKAEAEYSTTMRDLDAELQRLRTERQGWERRVALMSPETVDRDLLDEEARAVLDRVGKNDLVVFTDAKEMR